MNLTVGVLGSLGARSVQSDWRWVGATYLRAWWDSPALICTSLPAAPLTGTSAFLRCGKVFYCFSAPARVFSPDGNNKTAANSGQGAVVRVFDTGGGLVSFFLRCPEKSKGNSLKCDTAQLRTAVFFPYLINKNTPPLLCVFVLRRRWWIRVSSFAAALFLWQPRISSAAAWLKRQESGTSVWVCGYVSLTSIALFHQWELDLTMPSSILMWSQEDFAAARISSPHQPRGESSVCLAKLMMSGRDSWLVSSRAAWGKFHGYTSLMKTYNEPYFLSLPSLYCLSLSPST